VANNARYWAEQIAGRPADAPTLHRERDNIVKALGRALQLDAAWEPAADLLLTFHQYMERQGALADWERFIEAGLEISQRQGDLAAEAALHDRLGELKRDQGDWTGAIACHRKAYTLCEERGDRAGCARALANLGQVHRLQRRYREAKQALEEALSSYGSSQNLDGQAFALLNLGLVHFDEYQWEKALECQQAAYQIWSEAGNREGMARAQHNMGIAYQMQGDLPRSESSLQSAIALYEETHSRLYLAVASMDLGNVYLKGQPDRAEVLYRQARKVMEETRYTRGLAQVFNNLGMACTQQRKWALADASFRQSISHWRQLGEPVGQANAEDNLADAYLQQQKWEAARETANRALERLSGLKSEGRVEDLLSDIHEHLRMAEAGLDAAAEE
jgi:tetratricopeptide (TPR) repeat protein